MPRIVGVTKSGKTIGEIAKLGYVTLPFGYLACDGSAVSRTTFAALFALVGTTYGVGDGSTTFNVPDLRGRTPMGDGSGSGLTARTIGQAVGTETHTLGGTNLPSHTHGVSGNTGGGSVSVSGNVSGGSYNIGSTITFTSTSNQGLKAVGDGGYYVNDNQVRGPNANPSWSQSGGSASGQSFSATTDGGPGSATAVTHTSPATVVKYGIAYI